MFAKRLLCAMLISGLILSGCASKTTSPAPSQAVAPIPQPVNIDEAAPYSPRAAKTPRRLGALRILCRDIRFANTAQPVYLLPDLPQIREYFANYYETYMETGVSDPRMPERFRALYAPYTRSAKAEMEQNPPLINFADLPAGGYIVFFAPNAEQPPQVETPQEHEKTALGDMFLLRARLDGAKTLTLALGEADVPMLGDWAQRARTIIVKDAPLPPGGKEEDAILLQSGDRLLWPEGAVLRLPLVPPPPQEKEEMHPVLQALALVGFIALTIAYVYFKARFDSSNEKQDNANNFNW
ncbi:MAG: hypothetical protein LBH94_03345 [Deltaproteobacteria bacterium]|jgi:hypothetical protein|nr:hypothetical protein [Deltaproteobacteria bacterium]